MSDVIDCRDSSDLTRFDAPAYWPPLSRSDWIRTRPDANWVTVSRNDMLLARCSAWWTRVPNLDGYRLGFLGHFAAADSAAGEFLLRHALAELKTRGVNLAIGPINGSTWEPYRFVTESDGTPPFFLEPRHPSSWVDCFTAAGFGPWARYRSAICDDLHRVHRAAETLEARLASRNRSRLRACDPTRLAQELHGLYRMSCRCFAGSFLFSPGDEATFIDRYKALMPSLDPELIWIAERDETPAGFVFCVPDRLQDASGHLGGTLVIKTLAVCEQRGRSGLSLRLMRRVLQVAEERGYRRAILALMHERNISSRMAGDRMNARLFRRYTLFARPIP